MHEIRPELSLWHQSDLIERERPRERGLHVELSLPFEGEPAQPHLVWPDLGLCRALSGVLNRPSKGYRLFLTASSC